MYLRDPSFKVNQERAANFILEEIRREAMKSPPFPYSQTVNGTSNT